ncbi:hypothetical protein M0R45_005075 [Rubus argutus]|uniref:NB-ARC domain-containing protein n=1 Tax=Rubus argutus TaxID=59490 RepID=A0AAW1YLN3_RUBAR
MERLCSGLPKHNGGAVIVTTRLKQVAQKMGKQHSLVHVKPLDRVICWRIFKETFKNRFENFRDFLLDIAKEIKDRSMSRFTVCCQDTGRKLS